MLPSSIDEQMHHAFLESTRLVASVVPNGAATRVGDWFVYDAAVDNVDFNTAAVCGDPSRAASQLEQMECWYEERNAQPCLRLRPGPDDPVISAIAGRYNVAGRREPYLVLELARFKVPVSPLLRIERVCEAAGIEAYDSFDAARGRPAEWSIAADVSRLPGCALWLGWSGDRVAARAMSVGTTPVATIHNVVVVEELRRRGFGKEITWAALGACAGAGASYACLGSSAMGLPMYLAMGFEYRYDLAGFIRKDDQRPRS